MGFAGIVGEYSSGKTTIINILTSTHRQTGTDVTTDEPYKLRWNNIWVIDTPGLGSGRQEHDKKTEEWLAAADLLVYVITPDLFGSGSGARFLEMLDKYKRAHEMMIVVNMIDKEGNDIAVFGTSRHHSKCPAFSNRLNYPIFTPALTFKYSSLGSPS